MKEKMCPICGKKACKLCGMLIDNSKTQHILSPNSGENLFFCYERCRQSYLKIIEDAD